MDLLCLRYPHSLEYETRNRISNLKDGLNLKTASRILIFHKYKPRKHADFKFPQVSEFRKGFSKSSYTNESLAPSSLSPIAHQTLWFTATSAQSPYTVNWIYRNKIIIFSSQMQLKEQAH